jgi:hypothetical protein
MSRLNPSDRGRLDRDAKPRVSEELELDMETIKDLEPRTEDAAVRGASNDWACHISTVARL